MSNDIEWRKSSRSNTSTSGECVELSTNVTEVTHVRDSKDSRGPRLTLRPAGLAALVGQIKSGALDL
ncbi:DUF397 domain-containing protein [Actinomadura macrotermitis]|uniref:DUF397 domain-containing protein n=1 Tax=Actinomadura macrotermitis TaxID=2585200 RepID=A0A7K0BWP2_9ACTN|nr:DUF397 domain-containing protein [Actinomadura macrotermitis]MQY05603.1 hypothetical protein [Actinomadura macrotermitis]